MIVVDASVLSNVLGDDGHDGRLARKSIRAAGDISAPDLVNVETTAVLRKRWIDGTITKGRFVKAIDDLEAIQIDRYPTLKLMRRAYQLRDNLTPYDAVYVALAELLKCELLTGDAKLAKAPGPKCKIRLL